MPDINIHHKLAVRNGFVEIPDLSVIGYTKLTPEEVLALIPGSVRRRQASVASIVDNEWIELPPYERQTDAPDYYQILRNATLDDASFSYVLTTYPLADDTDSDTPVITGLAGGTFSVAPAGLVINASTGMIDLDPDESTAGTYIITYTTNGLRPNSSSVEIVLEEVVVVPDDATFYYPETTYQCEIAGPGPGDVPFGNNTFPYGFELELNICDNYPSESATILGVPGGVFTITPPGPGNLITIDSGTGALTYFDAGSVYGIHTVRYTTPAGPNQNFSEIQINAVDNF